VKNWANCFYAQVRNCGEKKKKRGGWGVSKSAGARGTGETKGRKIKSWSAFTIVEKAGEKKRMDSCKGGVSFTPCRGTGQGHWKDETARSSKGFSTSKVETKKGI